MVWNGVNDGIRTHDRRSHNPELYQLSYVHHELFMISQASLLGALVRQALPVTEGHRV